MGGGDLGRDVEREGSCASVHGEQLLAVIREIFERYKELVASRPNIALVRRLYPFKKEVHFCRMVNGEGGILISFHMKFTSIKIDWVWYVFCYTRAFCFYVTTVIYLVYIKTMLVARVGFIAQVLKISLYQEQVYHTCPPLYICRTILKPCDIKRRRRRWQA